MQMLTKLAKLCQSEEGSSMTAYRCLCVAVFLMSILPNNAVAQTPDELADFRSHIVQKYRPTGKLLLTLGEADQPGCGSSRVRQPDDDGSVISRPPDQLIMKLNPAGIVLLRVTLDQTAVAPGKPGEVDWVHTIAVDSKGRMYLGDIQGKRIHKSSMHHAAAVEKP